MNLRPMCCTVLIVGTVYGVSTEATADPRDFTPALCYLAAAQAIAEKNLADILGVNFNYGWPPECKGPSVKLLQQNPAEYTKKMEGVFAYNSERINQLGFQKLPGLLTFSASPGCPKSWSKEGALNLKQSDFRLEFDLADEVYKGAIVQSHIVIFIPVAKEGEFEPLYGDWKSTVVELRNNDRSCRFSLRAAS